MKLNHIVKELENTTPDAFKQQGDRRDMLKTWGGKLAAAAVPAIALSLFSKKAEAKTTDVLSEAIVFGLSSTTMQIAFYEKALSITSLIPDEAKPAFTHILEQKKKHRDYWHNILVTTGNPLPPTVNYDFTAKGAFPKVFTDYKDFITLAHTLEDVGVRMYAQTIQDLASNKALRGDAINVRCTMARHAAHVRLRRRNLGIDLMPWVTGQEAHTIVGELIQGYQGEELTMQQNYEVVNINGSKVTMKAASEAFDEPFPVLKAQAFMAKYIVT